MAARRTEDSLAAATQIGGNGAWTGGGSTTMVVGGEVVNRPSDPVGPRSVSDVLLVLPRPALQPGAAR